MSPSARVPRAAKFVLNVLAFILAATAARPAGESKALRDGGTIGDVASLRLDEELDWTELGWAQVLRAAPPRP